MIPGDPQLLQRLLALVYRTPVSSKYPYIQGYCTGPTNSKRLRGTQHAPADATSDVVASNKCPVPDNSIDWFETPFRTLHQNRLCAFGSIAIPFNSQTASTSVASAVIPPDRPPAAHRPTSASPIPCGPVNSAIKRPAAAAGIAHDRADQPRDFRRRSSPPWRPQR